MNLKSKTMEEREWSQVEISPQQQQQHCPRCGSSNTKFCYYNNYSLTQPRYFCKGCRRYWTKGGSLRNVPVGGGCRKNRRGKSLLLRRSNSSISTATTSNVLNGQISTTSRSSGECSNIDLAVVYANFLNHKQEEKSGIELPELPSSDISNFVPCPNFSGRSMEMNYSRNDGEMFFGEFESIIHQNNLQQDERMKHSSGVHDLPPLPGEEVGCDWLSSSSQMMQFPAGIEKEAHQDLNHQLVVGQWSPSDYLPSFETFSLP